MDSANLSPRDQKKPVDIAVAICSYNRSKMLRLVLESLCDQTFPSDRFEVVITDDASTDGTSEMLEELKEQMPFRLVHVRHPHNRGITAARNTCVRNTNCDVVLFVDDDVICDQHLLEEHWKIHAKHEKCVCNGWVNHVSEAKRPAVPKMRCEDLSNTFFWTSNVSVRRKWLIMAGLFDEDFIEYGFEDKDMGLRLKAMGVVQRNNRKAIGFHVKPEMIRGDLEAMCRRAVTMAHTAHIYVNKHNCLHARLSTGIITFPWLFAHRLTKVCNWLESLCLHRLNRPGITPETKMTGLDAWCMNRLSQIYYYDELLRYMDNN